MVRTCLELQQRVVPARKREMSSCGSSTLDPKGRAGLCSSPPVLLPTSVARGPSPGALSPEHGPVLDCRTWVPASLPSPLNSPKLIALLLP